MPGPMELLAAREAIASNEANFRKILSVPKLKRTMGELVGTRVVRVPKGFAVDHPAADLLRMKQFYFFVNLPVDVALGKKMRPAIIERFKLMDPLVRFLNDAALSKLQAEPHGEERRPKRPDPMF